MKRIYLSLAFIFLLILISTSVYLYINNQEFIKTKVLRNVSTAQIFTQGNQLKINFQIVEDDKETSLNFSNALGINSDWLDGISINLDANSLDKIKQNLPMQVDLKFKDKELDLNSNLTSGLDSSLPIQNYEIASGSGNLNLEVKDGGDFDLMVDDPGSVVEYATSSGKLYLSNQIQQLFPIMSKIARIRLIVRNRNVSGSIVLK